MAESLDTGPFACTRRVRACAWEKLVASHTSKLAMSVSMMMATSTTLLTWCASVVVSEFSRATLGRCRDNTTRREQGCFEHTYYQSLPEPTPACELCFAARLQRTLLTDPQQYGMKT